MSQDLNTLTAAPVQMEVAEVDLANIEYYNVLQYDDTYGSKFGFIGFDANFSIATTNYMMMIGESVTDRMIAEKELNIEILEGTNEIANQITGCLQDFFKNNSFFLSETVKEFTFDPEDAIALEVEIGRYVGYITLYSSKDLSEKSNIEVDAKKVLKHFHRRQEETNPTVRYEIRTVEPGAYKIYKSKTKGFSTKEDALLAMKMLHQSYLDGRRSISTGIAETLGLEI